MNGDYSHWEKHDDIVDELRRLAAPPYDSACFGDPMLKAADEIERLQREVDRLQTAALPKMIGPLAGAK